jgi:hypothetical protein
MTSAGAPEHIVALLTGLYQIARAGHTAAVTDTVEKVTGRAPISFEQFALDHKSAWL